MESSIVKRSIELHGHKTSVSLEDDFWNGLHEIAALSHTPLSELIRNIDSERGPANLSSAIRVFVFSYFRSHPRSAAAQPHAHAQPQAGGEKHYGGNSHSHPEHPSQTSAEY